MFVTTAIVGVRRRKEPSLSSASATKRMPGAEARVRAEGVHLAADDDGGVEPRGARDGGDEGGRRRLAVGAGDRHRVLHAHQLGEHLGARDDRDLEGAGADDLRVRRRDGARVHDDVRADDVLRLVADVDAHAEGLEALRDLVGLQVGAGDVELERP
jgi:hypothetical protein